MPKCRRSLRQSVVVVQQVAVVDIEEVVGESRPHVDRDRVDLLRHAEIRVCPAEAFETFPNGLGHGRCHRFAGEVCELLEEPIRVRVLDVEAHGRSLPSLGRPPPQRYGRRPNQTAERPAPTMTSSGAAATGATVPSCSSWVYPIRDWRLSYTDFRSP